MDDREYIVERVMDKWDNSQVIENGLYIIDKIRPELERGNFRAIYRYTEYLKALVYLGAIMEERQDVGWPIIVPPDVPN